METLISFLMDLRRQGISVWAEENELRFRAPKGAMTPPVKAALQHRKEEILAFVRAPTAESIPLTTVQDDYPPSHAQRRMWVLSQDERSAAAYHIPLKLLLVGALDVAGFSDGLNRLVTRHESLRTSFILRGTDLRQRVEDRGIRLRFVDLTEDQEQDREVDRLAREEALRPFDLAEGPLLRAVLLKLAARRHVFLLTVHHIVCDGLSLGVMVRDFSAFYRSACSGDVVTLPDLRVQYRDYSAWHNNLVESAAMAGHRQYWLEQLKPPLPVLDLPGDFPRPVVQTANGGAVEFRLTHEITQRLRALCLKHNSSLFIGLTTVLNILLHRYTGQEDILVGTPVGGRPHLDLADQVGLYLNTIVLRNRVTRDVPVDALLRMVTETATDAYQHASYPFDLLVDELDPPREVGRSPIFGVSIILQPNERPSDEGGGIEFHHLPTEIDVTKFDLTFDFVERENGLHCGIEYNTDLFAEDRIRRMGGHFQSLVAGLLDNPRHAIGMLPLMSEGEKLQILNRQHCTATPPVAETVVDAIEAQVWREGAAIAVSCKGRSLTYDELNIRSNQVARYLRARGVGPEVPVGVCLERSLELVVTLLGILKSGGYYIPLDPDYPKERLEFMAADSAMALLVTDRPSARDGFARGIPRVHVDADWPAIGRQSGDNLGIRLAPLNVAYTIYTSGSTGRPKGVQISHGSLFNLLAAMRCEPGMTAADVLLAVTTISFDIAALELFLPLVSGGRVVVAPAEVAIDGTRLLQLLNQSGATVMQATPACWAMLIHAEWTGRSNLKILCGGEALPPHLAEQLQHRGASLWNLYGPTETTIWSAAGQIAAQASDDSVVDVSIGPEIRNTQFYVLDASLQLLPVGVPGELHVGGVGLARGYVAQPALTARRFIPNPLGAGDRLYKTGDLVELREDGRLRFLGRLDTQVKVRGYRIETGEIEGALSSHEAVAQSAVVVREDSMADSQLVAYVVPTSKGPSVPADLRLFLQERLPHYMVPSLFIFLDRMPLSPAGKIDRRALPAPNAPQPAMSYVAPRTDIEQIISAVWRDLLDVARVGIHDNFFELGGNSLKGTAAVSLIARALGTRLTLTDLFREPTIEGLARISTTNARTAYRKIARLEDEMPAASMRWPLETGGRS